MDQSPAWQGGHFTLKFENRQSGELEIDNINYSLQSKVGMVYISTEIIASLALIGADGKQLWHTCFKCDLKSVPSQGFLFVLYIRPMWKEL